jgi:hypothetical protein
MTQRSWRDPAQREIYRVLTFHHKRDIEAVLHRLVEHIRPCDGLRPGTVQRLEEVVRHLSILASPHITGGHIDHYLDGFVTLIPLLSKLQSFSIDIFGIDSYNIKTFSRTVSPVSPPSLRLIRIFVSTYISTLGSSNKTLI